MREEHPPQVHRFSPGAHQGQLDHPDGAAGHVSYATEGAEELRKACAT